MKKKKKSLGKWRTPLIVAGAALVAILALASPYFLTGSSKKGTVYLRKGSTIEAVHDSIAKNIDNEYADRVVRLLRISGADMSERHGAFVFEKGTSPFTAARRLRSGASNSIRLVINNLRTKQQLAALLGSLYADDAATFARALNNDTLCAKLGMTADGVMTYILADSYEFLWDVTPEHLLESMKKYYDKFWTDERKAKAKKLNLSPEQAVVIASIAEEETSKPDERGKVARLYLNRLHSGMRLQADPTVKFAIGDFTIKRLTHDMLQKQSPYNTYRVNGLPPGPIRFVEKADIDALLNSEAHNYMYMCAKSDFSGYHDFTVDYQSHLDNAHRYQNELNKRNIK